MKVVSIICLLRIIYFFEVYSVSEFKKIEFFENYFKKKDEKNEKSDTGLNIKYAVEDYLKNDINYKKKKLEINYLITKSNPVFSILPTIRYTPNNKQYNMGSSINVELSISNIFEEFMSYLFSKEKQKAYYSLKEYEQNTVFKIHELIKKFLELFSEIRSEYKVYLYLISELDKKQNLYRILEEEELNDIFILRMNILNSIEKLYRLNNDLELLIVENKEYFTPKNIEKLIDLFDNVNNISLEPYSMEYIKKPKTSKIFFIGSKLPIKILFNRDIQMGSLIKSPSLNSWKLIINPAEYFKYIINSYYNYQYYTVEEKFALQEWIKKMILHEEKRIFYEEKLQHVIATLQFMEKTIENENLLKYIKPKNIWDQKSNVIRKNEEKILVELLIILYRSLVIK